MVALEERPRKFNGIEVWPVEQFLQKLWNKGITEKDYWITGDGSN